MVVRAVGVNHVAFEVRDLDEALAWCQRFFEFTLRGRRAKMAWIDLTDQFIAISEAAPPSPRIAVATSDWWSTTRRRCARRCSTPASTEGISRTRSTTSCPS